ncbi:MAG: hypothetical protein ABW019_00280 [Chitinophagaceae bacterium]
MSNDKQKTTEERDAVRQNSGQQGVDKAPGEERGKAEKVTTADLKGKKVDADPSKESGQPVSQP